jgi:hypothetical protein
MKFVLIKKQQLEQTVVTITTNAHYDLNSQEVIETVDFGALTNALRIPPEHIVVYVKGNYLTEGLIKAITPCYLRGSLITINGIDFPRCTCNPQYFYVWQEKVPASLPAYLKDAYYNFKLRGELYNDLTAWNQARIAKANSYSKFKWSVAEDFYKTLYKTFLGKLKVLSPNKKTFFEATAELDVENWVKPSAPLSVEEQAFLNEYTANQYAKALGLQDVTIQLSTRHRITEHGVTDEPIVTCKQDIANGLVAGFFRNKTKSGDKLSSWNSTSSTYVVSHTKERENIETLRWYLSLPRETLEELLLPGWHFCRCRVNNYEYA